MMKNIKKLFTMMLVVLLCFGLIPAEGFAGVGARIEEAAAEASTELSDVFPKELAMPISNEPPAANEAPAANEPPAANE
ncbi:MAG: hypothetical protein RSA86_02965, partial [Christensenellaceae bacterium]